ncbi:MAG TPA: hypothetical protein PKO09_09165 [Anaerolineae bacterium]|nr:hypothetical protein [Anaerolineae bacterium]
MTKSIRPIPPRLRARTVFGESYRLGDLTITPEARVIGFGRARANIGAGQVSGTGAGFALVTPAAVVVSTPQGERRIPIVNATAAALWRRAALAAAVLLLGALAHRLALRR